MARKRRRITIITIIINSNNILRVTAETRTITTAALQGCGVSYNLALSLFGTKCTLCFRTNDSSNGYIATAIAAAGVAMTSTVAATTLRRRLYSETFSA